MANFLEIKIPVKKDEGWNKWAKEMRSKIRAAGIPVRWQMFHYHMTILFLDDDNCVKDLNQEFEQCMSVFYSLPITIDKLDAFTTGDGASQILGMLNRSHFRHTVLRLILYFSTISPMV